MITHYSPHIITDIDTLSFDPSLFSRFKVGSKAVAETFGKDLAINFIKDVAEPYKQELMKPFLAVPSPYGYLPKATTPLIHYFAKYYNEWASENNLASMQVGKITRYDTHTMNYNILNANERAKVFEKDEFTFDLKMFEKYTILSIDDIKITGTAEKLIQHIFKKEGLKTDVIWMNYAELHSETITPDIEFKLKTGGEYIKYVSKNIVAHGFLLESNRKLVFNELIDIWNILNIEDLTSELQKTKITVRSDASEYEKIFAEKASNVQKQITKNSPKIN